MKTTFAALLLHVVPSSWTLKVFPFLCAIRPCTSILYIHLDVIIVRYFAL